MLSPEISKRHKEKPDSLLKNYNIPKILINQFTHERLMVSCYSRLTLPAPCISDSCIKIEIHLNFILITVSFKIN